MKRTLSTLLVLLFFLVSCPTAPLSAEPLPLWAAKNTEGNRVRIAIPAPEDERFAHLSWNKVVRTAEGTIIIAYSAGTFHGHHGGGSPAVLGD